jgi:hypothetical protein
MLNHLGMRHGPNWRTKQVLVAVVGMFLLCAACSPAPGDTAAKGRPSLELKTERVIVFKDGYSLIVKRGVAVTDSNGEIYTDEVPDAAVLGSFWAVPREGRLLSMLAGWKESDERTSKQLDCTQNIEILEANLGKACKVELSDKTVYSGTIRKVLLDDSTEAVPAALRSAFALPDTPGESETISRVAASHFILRTEDGDVLLPITQVRTVTIHDMKTMLERTVTSKKRTKRLTFRFEEPGQRRELLVMYFRPGLRWIPTYRVELSEDEKKKLATVTLQAEIINEAEDLADVPVDIVVGVPNFRFRDVPSPLVLESTLRNGLRQAAPQLAGQFASNGFSNAIFTQRVADVQPQPARGEAAIELPGELTGVGTQDLFIYNLPKLDFRKGERTAVQIFTAKVPYRDVYTWDLHLKRRDIEAAPSGAGLNSPLILSKNEVWHQVELTNNTNVPWTTGAAIVMQGHQPLGQELLTYTSPKSAVRVPVTVSVDTRGSFAEEEITRQLKALTWDHHHYAKIDKKATLRLRNYKQVAIDAEVTLRFGGKFDEISDDGSGTLGAFSGADWHEYRGSAAVNNSSTIRWRTTVAPGKAFEPTVKYHYLTRH